MIFKKHHLFFFCIFCVLTSYAQTYTGPIVKPTTGYGVDGTSTVTNVSITNPLYTSDVQVYYPTGTSTAVPTIFFAHGFTLDNPMSYMGFINFLVSKDYAVVFVPYPVSTSGGVTRYQIMQSGFESAAAGLPSIIDTTRVGFIGHSFGAGAIYSIANNLITTNSWGTSGKFLVPIAQWYSYNISQAQLQNFDSSTKLLSIITQDEDVTDHRMSIDMFRNINIPNNEKDIVLISTDVVGSYTYTADHYTSLTDSSFDALDYYGIYRLVDALADYTFTGNATGKDVALGNGSVAQVTMPTGMTSLLTDDFMLAQHPESAYQSPCTNALNPRSSYCAALSVSSNEPKNFMTLYPNPTKNQLNIVTNTNSDMTVNIYDMKGRLVKNMQYDAEVSLSVITIDLTNYPMGTYIFRAQSGEQFFNQKIVKH